MTAKDCILGRRSIRKFKADPVSHDLLAQIVETASYAPSIHRLPAILRSKEN
jgi:nitroreductase